MTCGTEKIKLKASQLVPMDGPKIWTDKETGWYRHTTYGFYDGEKFTKLPGRVQTKQRPTHGRNLRSVPDEIITCNDKGYCVRGEDLRWLIKEAGYEYEEKQE